MKTFALLFVVAFAVSLPSICPVYAHIQGSNVTRLFLERTESSFISLRSVQAFDIAAAPQSGFAAFNSSPAFVLSAQDALNSSSIRSTDLQIFWGPGNSTNGPFNLWNMTSFSHDPYSTLWSVSSTQGQSDLILSVAIEFNRSSSWDTPNKYLMWGKYSLAGTPPRLVGIPHRWHDPGPEEPIFNATSGQFDSWSSGDELDYFCSRTTTPGVKLRRTSSSIFFISRSFGSLKLIRYDSETMNPLWKRVLVPRVEPFGCAHTAGTRFSTMLTADPDTDDVWVVFTPLTPDALRSFVLWNNITLPDEVDSTKYVSILMGFDRDNNKLHWEVVEPKNGSCEPVPWVRGDIAVAKDRKRVAVVTSCLDLMDGGRHLDRGWIKVSSFMKNETHSSKLHLATQNKYTLLDLDADSVSLSSALYHTKSLLIISGEAGYRTDIDNRIVQGGDGFVSLFDSAAGGTMSMQRFFMGQRRTRRNSVTSLLADKRNVPGAATQTYYLSVDLDGPILHDPDQSQKIALYQLDIPTQVEAETPTKLWIVIGITSAVFVILGCIGIIMYIRQRRQMEYLPIQ